MGAGCAKGPGHIGSHNTDVSHVAGQMKFGKARLVSVVDTNPRQLEKAQNRILGPHVDQPAKRCRPGPAPVDVKPFLQGPHNKIHVSGHRRYSEGLVVKGQPRVHLSFPNSKPHFVTMK